MKFASAVIPFARKAETRSRQELAFLPAALEIVETPPSPIAGVTAATLIVFCCCALAWSYFSKVDIVAAATGKIIPSGRSKVIQPFETGVVRAIHVRDGQVVAAGDVLIEVDPTMNEAERQRIRSDLVTAKLDLARLRAAVSVSNDPAAAFEPPAEASAAQVETQRALLLQLIEEQRAKLAALDRQKGQKEAELATVSASVKRLEVVLPVLQQRVDIRKTLLEKEVGSKALFLELYQALVDMQQDAEVQRSRAREVTAALATIIETRAQTEAEYRRKLFTELVDAERRVGSLSEDFAKATRRTDLQKLVAPVDGTIQQLATNTVGGVVTPAQVLMVIVPADSHLEIEAMISNRDIGFIHTGQDVAIKVDTFSFTKYGLLQGKVLTISRDAITRDKPQDRSGEPAPGAENASSEPKGQELIYATRISLEQTSMQVDENLVNLSPGMAVTVEIRTGARRVIEYLLSPLLRRSQESLRER